MTHKRLPKINYSNGTANVRNSNLLDSGSDYLFPRREHPEQDEPKPDSRFIRRTAMAHYKNR